MATVAHQHAAKKPRVRTPGRGSARGARSSSSAARTASAQAGVVAAAHGVVKRMSLTYSSRSDPARGAHRTMAPRSDTSRRAEEVSFEAESTGNAHVGADSAYGCGRMTPASLHLATTDGGNDLLARDPLALLIGMLLDQQIPMEKAFTSPSVLRERLGHDLDATELANYDPAALEELFRTPPALHRFPAAMAKRVQALGQVLVEQFDGRPRDGVDAGERRHRPRPPHQPACPASASRRRGSSPPCWASSSTCNHAVGARRPGPTASADRSARSRTSSTPPRCRRSARSRSGEGRAARGDMSVDAVAPRPCAASPAETVTGQHG